MSVALSIWLTPEKGCICQHQILLCRSPRVGTLAFALDSLDVRPSLGALFCWVECDAVEDDDDERLGLCLIMDWVDDVGNVSRYSSLRFQLFRCVGGMLGL